MFEVRHLHFAYDQNVVFTDFSFSIHEGEILCVVGKNGSGKTTLLKVLCGLNYCPDLDCQIGAVSVRQNELKQRVAYVPTTPNFYENLSAEEYILWVGTLWNKDATFKKRADEYMRILNLDVQPKAEISSYSLGMKYKLYFCFLALDSPILLLDEPLNSLDIASRESAIGLIKECIRAQWLLSVFKSCERHDLESVDKNDRLRGKGSEMIRSRTMVLLGIFCVYVAVAFLVRDNYLSLLFVTLLFAIISAVLRNVILIKKDKPCRISIGTGGARITMDDSEGISIGTGDAKITMDDSEGISIGTGGAKITMDDSKGISITADDSRITMDDSKIVIEDTKKPGDSSKASD